MLENHTPACPIERRMGAICGEPLSATVAVPVCDKHAIEIYRRVNEMMYTLADQPRMTVKARTRRSVPSTAQDGESWVYYIQLPGDLIKIGYSTNLRSRVSGLTVRTSDVLALEPGGRAEEQERHLQFDHLRVRRTERFRDTPELRAHIAEINARFGRPVVRRYGEEPRFVPQ